MPRRLATRSSTASARKKQRVGRGWQNMTPEMKQRLGQCRHQLAGLIGDQTKEMATQVRDNGGIQEITF